MHHLCLCHLHGLYVSVFYSWANDGWMDGWTTATALCTRSQPSFFSVSGNGTASHQLWDNLHWLLVHHWRLQHMSAGLQMPISTHSTVHCVNYHSSAGNCNLIWWHLLWGDLIIVRPRTVDFGPWSFSAAGPSSWNSWSGTILQLAKDRDIAM